MGFDEIALSKDELSALKELRKSADKKQGVLVDSGNKTVMERLYHLEFAEIQSCTTAPQEKTLKWPFPRAAYITERGRDYLVYLNAQKEKKRSDRRHDISLLLISALIAVFFDHLDDLFDLARVLIEFLGERH